MVTQKKLEKYTRMEMFKPEYVNKVSLFAGSLCSWVLAAENYCKALKVVAPKRAKKAFGEEQLRKKKLIMDELENEFNKLTKKI